MEKNEQEFRILLISSPGDSCCECPKRGPLFFYLSSINFSLKAMQTVKFSNLFNYFNDFVVTFTKMFKY